MQVPTSNFQTKFQNPIWKCSIIQSNTFLGGLNGQHNRKLYEQFNQISTNHLSIIMVYSIEHRFNIDYWETPVEAPPTGLPESAWLDESAAPLASKKLLKFLSSRCCCDHREKWGIKNSII